jgi:DMSO/TMAO reductase YedYZ molybdopterin-dependent catalytic subunit
VVFYSSAMNPTPASTTTRTPVEQTSNRPSMLAEGMNGERYPFGHGAPLRLRPWLGNET